MAITGEASLYDGSMTPTSISTVGQAEDSGNETDILINTTLRSRIAHDTDEQLHEITTAMLRYASGPIIIFGTLGNLLTLVVLRSKLFCRMPSCFILSALALADIAVLNTGLMRHWIFALTDYKLDIRNLNVVSCKLHVFLTYFTIHVSAWTLVLLTLERLFSVAFPFRAKTMQGKVRLTVRLIWMAIFVLLAGTNSHIFFTVDFRYHNITEGYPPCHHHDYKDLWKTNGIWPIVDILVSTIVPAIVIFVSNILVIWYKGRLMRDNSTNSGLRVHTGDDSNSTSVTCMLIGISLLFLLTTTPYGIFSLGVKYWPSETPQDRFNKRLTFSVLFLLVYCNSSLNFVMYCLSGVRFRRALMAVVCRRQHSSSSSQSTKSSRNLVVKCNAGHRRRANRSYSQTMTTVI